MSFGPVPWHQTNWDWRAAANFVGGGAGAGLIVVSVLSGAAGWTLAALLLAGLALMGIGLFCVWLEIGRPLRALHVFFNPRTSWMSRESFVASVLFPVGLGAAIAVPGCAWTAAALALAFIYCQGRMLQAAKGIVAWREPALVPLFVITGLTEGTGLWLMTAPWHASGAPVLPGVLGALVLLRLMIWLVYRRRLAATAAPRAKAVLGSAGLALQIAGTFVPLTLLAAMVSGNLPAAQTSSLAAIAGLAAAAAGAYTKYAIITGAGFNQGFALVHLPVRGSRH